MSHIDKNMRKPILSLAAYGAIMVGSLIGNNVYQKDFVRIERNFPNPLFSEGYRNNRMLEVLPRPAVTLYSDNEGSVDTIGKVALEDLDVKDVTRSRPFVHVVKNGYGEIVHATAYVQKSKGLETLCPRGR